MWEIGTDMKKIKLTKGKYALVDEADFEMLATYKWHCSSDGYAVRAVRGSKIRMHRVIRGTPQGLFTDHINGNKLDNRRANLRICTNSQNQLNRSRPSNNKSGYKGVVFHKRDKVWQASIVLEGVARFLGTYKTKEEAAFAYDFAANAVGGEFAKTNLQEGHWY